MCKYHTRCLLNALNFLKKGCFIQVLSFFVLSYLSPKLVECWIISLNVQKIDWFINESHCWTLSRVKIAWSYELVQINRYIHCISYEWLSSTSYAETLPQSIQVFYFPVLWSLFCISLRLCFYIAFALCCVFLWFFTLNSIFIPPYSHL